MDDVIFTINVLCNDNDLANQLSEDFAIIELFPSFSSNADKTIGTFSFFYSDKNKMQKDISRIKKVILPHKLTLEELLLKKEDWAESWKKYFHTAKVSERFIIKPSWEEYPPKKNETIIQIDPGMSFGTGLHGTTRACLNFIDTFEKNSSSPLSMIDIGCGSGILSIGALLLNYNKVDLFDYDADAVSIAQQNLDINSVAPNNIFCANLFEYTPQDKYDLVVANILPNVLEPNVDKILSMVKPNGKLILAGILTDVFEEVSKTFIQQRCTLENTITLQEWTSGIFSID